MTTTQLLADPQPLVYSVAVRELCAFTAKTGDLDLRFTPAPSAQEGIAGHGKVTARRDVASYESEILLASRFENLQVRGRVDGFDTKARRLEEIKTFKGRLDRQSPAQRELHWAQARVYGWLMCEARGFASLDIALVYFDIDSERETVFTESWSRDALRAFFEEQCSRFVAWAQLEAEHRVLRDAALRTLAFAHAEFRTGQRELAEGVYRATTKGRVLLAQAPTGIGKTAGTIFPALKAMPGQSIDRLFYLSAKTSGRQLALDALGELRSHGGGCIRVLEMVAREKACENPGSACHGDACPLACGFYDRLPDARADALAEPAQLLDQESVRSVALVHGICPYYLSQELARWVDVVVGDYNYFFDFGGLLHALTQANDWSVALLVDEAHNLMDRARGMYSATLSPQALKLASQSATAESAPRVKKALSAVKRQWSALNKEQADDYAVHEAFPPKLLNALTQCMQAIGEHFADHPDTLDADVQAFQWEVLQVQRLLESFGEHSIIDTQRQRGPQAKQGDTDISVRNIVPAPYLAERWAKVHAATLFSATLTPMQFHADLLGLPEPHATLDVGSPFRAEQLSVQVARHISTRYAHRSASIAPMVQLMAAQFAERPGNYLAFFSSYEYLEQAADALARQHPEITLWRQSRRMGEAQQREFLQQFTERSQGIGFAVLGGAFAEGIDLPGKRLIGAFLATLGLPQFNPVNEQISARMERLFAGRGYDYAYLYPGLQKVVQAAGRVIRTPQDEGVVHLIDDRFARAEVRRLLPAWWHIDAV
ncbi:ATP-dependent DNA helicase [Diaphorobacter sp. HDW4A]|uniref:helicase C-terminal domain-containing protein n=1 Tax=Diaphorobacter sp. HDW4A TaxID=2714924 RepID=UPI00140BEA37|nr:helicase C-terminal domain-containing protein [Diaphorobacter sp. HDW4A]QIL82676.1 ATP-dependent DNA helicase [Diaphorobacter sp. HDW4A]